MRDEVILVGKDDCLIDYVLQTAQSAVYILASCLISGRNMQCSTEIRGDIIGLFGHGYWPDLPPEWYFIFLPTEASDQVAGGYKARMYVPGYAE